MAAVPFVNCQTHGSSAFAGFATKGNSFLGFYAHIIFGCMVHGSDFPYGVAFVSDSGPP